MESNSRIIKSREYLRYDFNNEELLDLSKTLARTHQELAGLEEQQKKIASDLKAQVQDKESVVNKYSRLVNNGYEYRDVDCEIRYHDPKVGLKTIVRLDSGEVVKTTSMSGNEMQDVLFEETELQNA